jgi:hemolysin activation/secretion protein
MMNRHQFFLRLTSAALAMVGLAGALHAQTFEQVAPKTLPVTAAAVLPTAPQPDTLPVGAGERVLLPVLRGLVFVPNQGALLITGVTVEGLHVSGIALLTTAEFHTLVASYLGQPLTLSALNRLTHDVVLYFRRHGRPVVDVLVPEQNISTGTVQILVIEGRLGQVRTEGNKWFTAKQISTPVRTQPGEVIASGPLLADIAWINQNPFREVDLVFARGSNPGETDIILRTYDLRPLRVYTGYEDSGNALTGFDRVLAGFNWGNAFGRSQQLNYQFTASPDLEKLKAHSGSYVVPLPAWRHTLTLFGSYARSQPMLGDGTFALDGRAWQVGARYQIPLTEAGAAWTRTCTLGIDFKRSNNNLAFGGTQVFAQESDVIQGSAVFSLSHPDSYGVISGDLTLVLSPGGLTHGNSAPAYQAARSFARPDYGYAKLELERKTKLPAGFFWVTRGIAQLASTNLLGTEQLGLGGASNLRGYEDREANGDDGFVLVNEIHIPPFRVLGAIARGKTNDQLDPLVFLDYGTVANHERLPGEPSRLELASAGLGFRYNLRGNFNLRAVYGWQLKPSGVSDLRRSQRGHIGVVVSF